MSKQSTSNKDLQQNNKNAKESTTAESGSKAEDYMKKNRRGIIIALLVVVVIVGGILLYRNARQRKVSEAEEAIFRAEQLFEQDSFATALKGNGADIKGFLQIIDEYGSTPSGNLAHAYAGVSYYQLGDYESAIKQLEKFSAGDIMVKPSMLGLIGDCYVETDHYDKAVSYFEQAAKKADNMLLSPVYLIKAGLTYEALGQYDKAKEVYTRVKESYPSSPSSANAEKYLQTLILQGK